jgi:hypothetical protein
MVGKVAELQSLLFLFHRENISQLILIADLGNGVKSPTSTTIVLIFELVSWTS